MDDGTGNEGCRSMRTFVKPLWNVRHDVAPERTTLATETVERKYGTGRGYCVTADSAKEAASIAMAHQYRHNRPEHDRVQLIDHKGVIVLMAPPSW